MNYLCRICIHSSRYIRLTLRAIDQCSVTIVPQLATGGDTVANCKTIKCSNTWGIDIVELQRQYNMLHWDRETYRNLILEAEEPLTLKVIRFKQTTVGQMLHQTTTTNTYLVDTPITPVDVLRHMNFATKASERRLYGISTRPLLDIERVRDNSASEISARRTVVNDGNIRNVRQRLEHEGPIRVPLILDVASEQESISQHSDATSNNGSQEEESTVIELTGEDDNSVIVVNAIDPGTSIAQPVNPVFEGTQIHHSFHDYARQLEERLLALENRCDSYLSGELSDEQLRSLDDSLQMKLSRIMFPMLDTLARDIQDFMDKTDESLDKRALTREQSSTSRMKDMIGVEVSILEKVVHDKLLEDQQQRLNGLTVEMHECFVKAEELSSAKVFTLQESLFERIMTLSLRIQLMEQEGVKDRTLASNHANSVQNRLQLVEEGHLSTKLQMGKQHEESLSRNLMSTAQLEMTLETTVNAKFEALEHSIMDTTIQRMDTYLENKLIPLLSPNEALLIESQEDRLKMLTMIRDNEVKQRELSNQVMIAKSSVTNLEEIVTGLKFKLQELTAQLASEKDVRMDEQLRTSNAPTGAGALTNSYASLYLTSGAAQQSEMTGGGSRPPPTTHIMNGQQPVPPKGEYMFTRWRNLKYGLPVIESSSANAPNMQEMYDNMLPGSSDESFSDSDYHSSDGNSVMDIDDGSDPSSSSSSSSESSSDSSSSSSDSSSETSDSSGSNKRSKKNKKRKRKEKKHKKSKHRKQETLFPQTPFRSLSPIGHTNTHGTPSNMLSTSSFPNLQGGTHTLRMAAPPPISMVRSATWEDLEKLRRQIEVAEIQKFEVKICIVPPSVTLAIEKTVKKYFEEEGRTDWVEKIWTLWDNSLFFHNVNGRFRVGTVAKDSKQDFLDEVRTLNLNISTIQQAKCSSLSMSKQHCVRLVS